MREAIADAAAELFAERGYAATSVREVVERAGCTKPVLYYYFANKSDLFLHVLNEQVNAINYVVDDALRATGTLRERMRHGLRAYLDFVQAHPRAIRILMSAERHPEQGQPSYDFESLRERHLATLKGLFEEGQARGEVREGLDLDELSLALFGVIEHRVVLWLHGREIPRDFADRTIALFFDGVGA